jgi:hypothetical protein
MEDLTRREAMRRTAATGVATGGGLVLGSIAVQAQELRKPPVVDPRLRDERIKQFLDSQDTRSKEKYDLFFRRSTAKAKHYHSLIETMGLKQGLEKAADHNKNLREILDRDTREARGKMRVPPAGHNPALWPGAYFMFAPQSSVLVQGATFNPYPASLPGTLPVTIGGVLDSASGGSGQAATGLCGLLYNPPVPSTIRVEMQAWITGYAIANSGPGYQWTGGALELIVQHVNSGSLWDALTDLYQIQSQGPAPPDTRTFIGDAHSVCLTVPVLPPDVNGWFIRVAAQ